ncbi:biliverdin-producing heme oxygenase [Larkinella soli]|uniref:biliverdin-producing heme oxygenase n=1 Tax=Larkinella soli TaxID=1770527 RepID=UPI000FFBAF64|nr:biliverdin-producing heme oxygenase [Larkinella soli]
MTLLEQLRAETRLLHEQTEQLLYADALRSGTLSPRQYGHLLRMQAAYHDALEKAIDRHPAFFADYEPDRRRKTPWLRADLTSAGQTLPALSEGFADWSPAQLLGAAYVGEGSMLGGKTVWHYLNQSPALRPLLADARFYRGYGPETGTLWRTFIDFLSRQDAAPAEVVEGARQAFRLFQELFDRTRADLRPEPAYSAD